jgi:hypothetical protein
MPFTTFFGIERCADNPFVMNGKALSLTTIPISVRIARMYWAEVMTMSDDDYPFDLIESPTGTWHLVRPTTVGGLLVSFCGYPNVGSTGGYEQHKAGTVEQSEIEGDRCIKCLRSALKAGPEDAYEPFVDSTIGGDEE